MEKLKITAHIERGTDGNYGIYYDTEKYNLDYLCIGDGNTVEEAIKDFYVCYEEMKNLFKSENKYFQEATFEFHYDTASFLQYYTTYFSIAGLSRMTGIHQGQLSHYITGHRNPSKQTISRIDKSVHQFAEKLSRVQFV
jgi:hypothetical protein